MLKIAKFFLILGGINWGVFGIGILLGRNFNLIGLLSAFYPILPTILYLLIGFFSFILIFKKD